MSGDQETQQVESLETLIDRRCKNLKKIAYAKEEITECKANIKIAEEILDGIDATFNERMKQE